MLKKQVSRVAIWESIAKCIKFAITFRFYLMNISYNISVLSQYKYFLNYFVHLTGFCLQALSNVVYYNIGLSCDQRAVEIRHSSKLKFGGLEGKSGWPAQTRRHVRHKIHY